MSESENVQKLFKQNYFSENAVHEECRHVNNANGR